MDLKLLRRPIIEHSWQQPLVQMPWAWIQKKLLAVNSQLIHFVDYVGQLICFNNKIILETTLFNCLENILELNMHAHSALLINEILSFILICIGPIDPTLYMMVPNSTVHLLSRWEKPKFFFNLPNSSIWLYSYKIKSSEIKLLCIHVTGSFNMLNYIINHVSIVD